MGTRFDGWNRCPPDGRGQAGLITLEWLLIVGTIAGLAASSTLIVQRVLDDHSDVPPDPVVRFIQADIAAAEIATEAQAAFDTDPSAYSNTDDNGFKRRCEVNLAADFSDVFANTPPPPSPSWGSPSDPDGTPGSGDEVAARCSVTPDAGLGG